MSLSSIIVIPGMSNGSKNCKSATVGRFQSNPVKNSSISMIICRNRESSGSHSFEWAKEMDVCDRYDEVRLSRLSSMDSIILHPDQWHVR